ncbi:GIP [Symbiodinium sp. CCMP2592]|nr:GIP [Symbiodinium sp. CCMP2592]
MANIGDETDEELTGPPGATASAHGMGPAPFMQPPPTNPFQPTSPTNAGSEIAMTAADLRVLMQRMSEATQAASAAAQAAAFASTAQGARPMGVGDLTKVLPKPDPFRPTTRDEEFAQWPQWSWTFEQYLSCLEPEFSSELREYGRQQTAVILSSLDDGAKRRSRLLYGMLNGLLYERGRRLLRSVQEQNGFEAWRLLSKDLMPKTRNRVLALLRTINSWPSFAAQQGLAQQLLRLESAFEEYERLEPGGLPENNKMATLLSCLTGQLRQHANVVISDDSTYSDLRELVLRWDGANTKWQTSVASSYGLSDGKKGLHDTGDVAPMDIDRVHAKGDKGKDRKGRPKGGKGDKGKDDKGKHNKGSKGDAGKGDKGKSKGGKDKGGNAKGNWPSVCSWCQKPGHYKRDCFQFKAYMQGHQKGARQVQANSSAAFDAGTSTTAPSSASALQAQQGKAGQSTVRRVAAEPLVFDMSDLEDPFPYEPNVCMITVTAPQSYAMDSQDDDDQWTLPPDDYAALDLAPSPATACVRAVTDAGQCVIIDSGADISCIPETFQSCGRAARARPLQVQDAQGGAMKIQAERLIEFVLFGGPRPVVIRERCIVAKVTQPLLSLGRLMRKGWWPIRQGQGDNAGAGPMCLRHPRSGAEVPLLFKGYSLAVNAQIRRVEHEGQDLMYYNPGAGEVNNHSEDEVSESEVRDANSQVRDANSQVRDANSQQVRDADSQQVRDADSQQVRDANSQQVRDADSQQVRDADSQQVRDADSQQVCDAACSHSQFQVTGEVQEVCPSQVQVASIQVRFEAKTLESLDFGWQVSSSGHLVWRGRTSRFVDPSFMAPIGWPLRSTLICRSGTWFLLEHCVPWADLKEVEAVLPGGQVAEVISFLHVQVEPVSEIGVQLPAGMTEPQGLPEPDFYHFRAETEQAPVGTVEHDRVVPDDEAMQGLEDAAGQPSPAPMPLPDQLEAGEPTDNVEPLSLDGVLIAHDSSLAVLKTAAAKLNLSTAGSKSRLFSRVKGYLEKQRLALELELAADAQSSGERQPRVQPVAAAPTEAERFLHECTHVPFKPWCPHCISMRAMPDRSEYLKEGPRDNPIIQFDFSFSGYSVPDGICNLDAAPEDSQRALKCLVAHDSATGMIAAIPCESKGDTRYLGIELMRFIQSLGHTTVTLKCDNEPSTLTLQRAIVTARQRLGLQTLVQNPAIGAKGSLGFCEKAIDSVRKLANTLLDQARHRTGLPLPTTHVLFAWAFVHSAWLLNRYRVIGNMTAYERACGAKYSGRIAPFAEPVYCQLDVKQKGDKRWMLGILVSKSSLNDMYIIAGKDGIRLSRSIRRVGQPWELEVQLYRELKGYPWDYGSGVIGTKFVAMPKQRPAAVDPVRDVAPPRSPDEAASEPPTPAVEALGMPVTPLGGAGAMAPPRRNVPPPESARAIPDESMAGVEAEPPGPNPAMRPDPPSTPEAELPPLKKLRIRAVTFGEQSYEVNDEGEFDLDQPDGWEVQTKLWSMESETDDSFMNEVKANPEAEVAEDDDRLWFPDNGREPELDDAILAELDNLADQVEVSRLLKKSVLRHATSDDDLGSMKSLTTKFVRTWRHKKRNGVPSWYRRSRLCAREFRWLDESKEGLFSPATSTDIVRLIPAQWLNWKQSRPSEQYAILALDVKDAYLEVPQPTPVVSKVQGQDLVFMRMVPGQREGSQQWFSHFCEYLGEHFVIEKCKECPAVVHVSSKPGSDGVCADKGPGMIHVDDSLLLLPLQWARECFLPVIEQRFQITYELAYEVGHSFSFLKREHTITEQGFVIRQPSSYIEQMKQTMNVTQNNRQRVPCWSELRAKDTTRELNHTDASKFRQAVGTALYISCDRPDVGYAVRMLASYMARPTEHAKVGLIKLIQYLINTCDYGILMKFAAPGTRKLNGYVYDSGCADDAERNVLEVFSDADWSGSKKDRRSYGGASFCVNGQYVHYICRSQKCISLSSMESEYYSAVGSACQGLFMKAVIEFMSRSPCDLILYVDNQSCKAFCLRQGVTKASKHFEGRLLWLQDIVQQKRLVMKYISTHFNLGDLHTKPLSPSRLRTLLFLHDFVDCHSRPIGENEWEHTCTAATIRAQVKRVRTVAGNDMSNTWVKRVAMLLLMMPIPAEASAVTSVNMSACFFLAVLVSMYMAVYAMESTAEHGANGGDEGWLYIAAPGGPWYRRGAMYAACVMMATIAWGLGSISAGFFRDVEIESTTTTTTTTTTSSSHDMISFMLLCGLLCILVALSILLVRTRCALNRERTEVRELGALCSALWDEQKDDKRALHELKRENRSLRDENAMIQLEFYEMPHGRQCAMRDATTQT